MNVGKAVLGPAKLNWGTVTANFNGSTSIWGNVISGAGGITKQGTGTLRLTQANRYSGATRVEAGTLSSVFDLPAGASISSGAVLELQNGGVKGNLNNAGTLTVKGAGLGRTIGGNLVQSGTGVLSWQVGSPLSVTGTAQLAGELHVNGVAAGYVRSAQETVLTATGGLSGTFATLTRASNIFLQATPGYDANTAWLDITRLDVTAAAKAMLGSPASISSAQRVEAAFQQIDRQQSGQGVSVPVSAEFIALAGQLQNASSQSQAMDSLGSLSGELHARADAMTFDAMDLSRRVVAQRSEELLQQRLHAGGWFQALSGSRDAGPASLAANGFSMDGWMIGAEQALGGSGVLGLAFGETNANSQLDGADRSRDRQTRGMLYMGLANGHHYLSGQAGGGHYQRDLQRNLQLGPQGARIGSEYGGDYWSANVESGYRFGIRRLAVIPYLGLDYSLLQRDGFLEGGAAGFGLQANASSSERTRALAGVRMHYGSGRWRLRAFAEWQQWLSESGQWIEASFTGAESFSPLTVSGLSGSRGVMGMVLDRHLGNATRLSLGYDQLYGPVAQQHSVSATLQTGF